MEFNEKLQKLRKEQNLTQEELAEKLFVSRTAISKWESGRGYPSIDSLKVIAKYFHITIDARRAGHQGEKQKTHGTDLRRAGLLYRALVLSTAVRQRRFKRRVSHGVLTDRSKRVAENRFYRRNWSYGAQRLLRRGAQQLRQVLMEQAPRCHRFGTDDCSGGSVHLGKTALCRCVLPFRADYKGLFAAEKQMTRSVSSM